MRRKNRVVQDQVSTSGSKRMSLLPHHRRSVPHQCVCGQRPVKRSSQFPPPRGIRASSPPPSVPSVYTLLSQPVSRAVLRHLNRYVRSLTPPVSSVVSVGRRGDNQEGGPQREPYLCKRPSAVHVPPIIRRASVGSAHNTVSCMHPKVPM